MKDIIIFGGGGFGREVHVLLKQINKVNPKFNILGFVDDNKIIQSTSINGLNVLGGINYLINYSEPVLVAMAILTDSKKKLIKKLSQNQNLSFCNLVHPDIYLDDTNVLGQGNILCHGMHLTCNITIGDFNAFNGRVGIGHDVKIGNFNLFGPNTFIAGGVIIGNDNYLAMNSSVLQKKSMGNRNIINMSSVIIRHIEDDGVYFGIPATRQKF